MLVSLLLFFFFNDTATTEIYTLSLHDALPISRCAKRLATGRAHRDRGRLPARRCCRWYFEGRRAVRKRGDNPRPHGPVAFRLCAPPLKGFPYYRRVNAGGKEQRARPHARSKLRISGPEAVE